MSSGGPPCAVLRRFLSGSQWRYHTRKASSHPPRTEGANLPVRRRPRGSTGGHFLEDASGKPPDTGDGILGPPGFSRILASPARIARGRTVSIRGRGDPADHNKHNTNGHRNNDSRINAVDNSSNTMGACKRCERKRDQKMISFSSLVLSPVYY